MSTVGLRERKKLETYRRLATVARELAVERGLEALTVEDIAAAADVSPRTFFNYFANKEDAIIGVDPTALADLRQQLLDRPEAESPLEAIRAVLAPNGPELADFAHRWALRTQLVCRYPQLVPRHLAGLAKVEQALAAAMAERLGATPEDRYPAVLVAVVVAGTRATLNWWESTGRSDDIATALDRTFADLAAGLTYAAIKDPR